MKKLRFILALFSCSMLIAEGSLHAGALSYCGTLTYIISDNHAVITGFEGKPEILELPSVIDGKKVMEIRENAFYKCSDLKKIVIPESVREIGHHAFYECTSLETAVINGNISKIAEGTFYGCKSLDSVSINSSPLSFGDYAFYGCESLESFSFPPSVTDIGEYSFADCASLYDLNINRELKNIDSYAFYNCENLNKVRLPDGLLSVGRYAIGFSCEGTLKDITITGDSDSIAEHYADENNLKFRERVYYENRSFISADTAAGILAWIPFAVIYALLMYAIITKSKRKKRRAF